jgi:hypothetical protein
VNTCESKHTPPTRFTHGTTVALSCRWKAGHHGYHTAEYGHTTFEWDDRHAEGQD